MTRRHTHRLYGMMAEFATPHDLVAAAEAARAAGFRKMDAFTPFPIERLSEALGHRRSRVPMLVLVGAILGCVAGYGLQYWISAVTYPLNVGGRPYNSWPAFIPVTFEMTILVAGIFTVFGMLALNGLPTPYHPVFNVERFALASRDRYFLCIESKDPKFDEATTRAFLAGLRPSGVFDVDP
jgi:ActD protein